MPDSAAFPDIDPSDLGRDRSRSCAPSGDDREGEHVPSVHPELCRRYDCEHSVTHVHDRYRVPVGPLTGERNVYTAGGGEVLCHYALPNLMLNVVPGRRPLSLVVPTAPDRCRVRFRCYYAELHGPGAARRIEADVTVSDQGRFSVRFQAGVDHFQWLLKRHYRDWLETR